MRRCAVDACANNDSSVVTKACRQSSARTPQSCTCADRLSPHALPHHLHFVVLTNARLASPASSELPLRTTASSCYTAHPREKQRRDKPLWLSPSTRMLRSLLATNKLFFRDRLLEDLLQCHFHPQDLKPGHVEFRPINHPWDLRSPTVWILQRTQSSTWHISKEFNVVVGLRSATARGATPDVLQPLCKSCLGTNRPEKHSIGAHIFDTDLGRDKTAYANTPVISASQYICNKLTQNSRNKSFPRCYRHTPIPRRRSLSSTAHLRALVTPLQAARQNPGRLSPVSAALTM